MELGIKVVCIFTLVALSFFPVASLEAKSHQSPLLDCIENIRNAAVDFTQTHLPGTPASSIHLKAVNDIGYQLMFEKRECMANMTIVIHEDGMRSRAGIFHVHFSRHGKAIIRYQVSWDNLEDINGWKTPWCDFIRSVYPNELEEQGCE